MKSGNSIFAEDKHFFSIFLNQEVVSIPTDFNGKNRSQLSIQTEILEKIVPGNYKACLIFGHADDEKDFVQGALTDKILQAIQMTFEDVLIINLRGGSLPFYKIKQKIDLPDKVILFGVDFSQIHLNFYLRADRPFQFDRFTFIQAPALETIPKDVEAKKVFWKVLQSVFIIKADH